MGSGDSGAGDVVHRSEEPGVTARPPAARRARLNRASESEGPTRMYDGHPTVAGSGAVSIEGPATAPASVTDEEAEDRTFVLDEDSLDDLALSEGENLEPSQSGTKSRGQPGRDGRGDDVFLGRNFGGFKVVRNIAAGGMASIFLGRKDAVAGFTQHAAIKVVHKHFAGERDFIDMFLDEARIAGRIQHPNVCRVIDFGEAEGTYFLALDYVHGETWGKLFSALVRSRLRLEELPAVAAYVVAQACEGLHAAHTAVDDNGDPLNIVHRDISPDNLLVGYDGGVRVLDFGVAHAEARITNTRAGIVKGRLAYMAPEQARGELVDRRSDVWSLGVLLREALERRRLFRRETEAQTIMAVTHEPLLAWKPGVPAELREIADKALSRDPSQRYDSARDLGIALTDYLRTLAHPVGMAELSARMDEVFTVLKAEKRSWMKQPIPEVIRTGSLPRPDVPPQVPEVVSSRARMPSLAEAHNRAPQETLRLPQVTFELPAVQPPRADKTTILALVVACLAVLLVAGLFLMRRSQQMQAPPPQVQLVGPSGQPIAPQQPTSPAPASPTPTP